MSSSASDADALRLLSIGSQHPLSSVETSYPNLTDLSADAGTLAGAISQLIFLIEIMRRLSVDLDLDEPLLPCDYFDMIAGSGFGG
jgi:hypothetical protein